MSNPWIRKWASEREDPKTLAHRIGHLYRSNYRLFQVINMVRRFITYEALLEHGIRQTAAKKIGICVNTMTKTCKEFDIDDEAIRQIRSIADPDCIPAKGSAMPQSRL